MLQRLVVPLLAVALGLMVVAPMVTAPALAQGDALVKVATDAKLGKILVDSKGMTLYLYSRDELGKSNCYNQCETNWPILRPPASGAPTGAADIGGTLGVIDRTDGTKQVTYNKIPLYYWKDDKAAGDVLGQAVGGVWWIVAPGVSTITPAVQQASPAASPAAAPVAPAATAAPVTAPAAPAAKPVAPAQAPAASPAALPRTGSVPVDPMPLTVGFSAAGAALTALGFALIRRRGRRD